ncbi:cation:proton antiporter [Cyanobium sp. WAJ14-Wanaka]|uniref:cation:proton antiporter domain-containing protein n=1 Tax=Cyanobium sp. WAJ14-Wanaka TaxID=2823725 RepID=UPI0020CC9347|nr:cation:proton antiporter [Cyanobium sp. WAJ14-Wanaka]MCP9774919.1 cation:proton antiporter [Cyanobium sp. WAJ14-Wanaka]
MPYFPFAATTGLEKIPLETQVLFIGLLFLGGLIISRFSIKIGVPAILGVLLLGLSLNFEFLNISFEKAEKIFVFGLALLLFYAGLKTDIKTIRGFLEYGLVLAIGGVAISSLMLGGLIWFLSSPAGDFIAPGFLNNMPIGAALLIAACLGSTDAGATISVLAKVQNLLPDRLRHLLEFESSVNDPAAILVFGVIGGIFLSSGAANLNTEASLVRIGLTGLRDFLQQVGGGLIIGALFGYVAKFVIDHLAHERSQLLIVAIAIAFADYGCTQVLGGSGFIAVYLTGLLMTNMTYKNNDINHNSLQEVLLPFNTMVEFTIFILFGLLVNPLSLMPALPVGILTAAALMLVARPLSVLIFQPLSPFTTKENLLVSWCGLRGAVPLALSYKLMAEIPKIRGIDPSMVYSLTQNAQSIVFIVVVLNLLVQGLSLPRLCSRLNLSAT